ncbi:MAG TPA: hypothetical protein VII43_07145 [Opitutaceae bacterium]
MKPGHESPRERVLAWTAAACVAVIVWMGLGWHALVQRGTYHGLKEDYYSREVHGFLSGHLYIDKGADFRRESPDPAIRAQAAYLLDASYFRGHWYLYFGVTPAALLLLPYAWLTGGDLDPRFAVVLFAVAGFLFSLGIVRMAARDHLGRMGAWFPLAAVPVLAFATAVPFLLTRALFYELAISAGYACSMSGAHWTYRALFGRGRPLVQLALASASLGLAVGCRPDLVLNMPVLAAAALLVAWWGRDRVPWRRAVPATAAAAVLPAATIGACLAAYNFERFGNPLEFGMSYSVNGFIGNHLRLASAAYLWPNLHWYLLTFPALSPFFPYVYPEQAYFGPPGYLGGEAMHGQFPVFALAAFVGLSALAFRKRLAAGRLAAYLALLGWMFAAVFAAMCAIGVHADRYAVDFQAPLALGSVLAAGMVASLRWKARGPWMASFGALAALAAAFGLFGGLQEFEAFKYIRTSTYQAMETAGNYPSRWLEELGVLHSGPVELKVVFPTDVKTGVIEPLLTAGTPEYSDSLYALEWPGGRKIELIADHHGYGGPRSAVIPIVPGQAYTLKIDMGALYPPLRHPYFAPYKTLQARLVKTAVHVEMDGKTVMDERMDSFDSPPWSVEAGRNDVTMTPYRGAFSGRILAERRLPRPPPEKMENTGLWRIRCALPMQEVNSSFPLFSSGATGTGDLVFVNILPGGKVRFGLDEWGMGGEVSEDLVPAVQPEHVIEIFIGPVAGKTPWPHSWAIEPQNLARAADSLRIWLDGRLVWRTKFHRAKDPKDPSIDVGSNLQGFSTAAAEFPGLIRNVPYSPEEAQAFLNRNLEDGGNGLWRIECVLPLQHPAASFPLIASGVTGAGAMVYLGVLPGNEARFGLDEWGIGGGLSEPFGAAPESIHVIEIFDGSLAAKASWPATWGVSAAALASSAHVLKVWMDGRLVWSTDLRRPFAPKDARITVGTNFQGFSTAPSEFPGVIQFDPYEGDAGREFLERNLAADK